MNLLYQDWHEAALTTTSYDLSIVTLGFEHRSRHVASRIQSPGFGVAFGFTFNHQGSYAQNKKWLQGHSWSVDECSDDKFRRHLVQTLDRVCEEVAAPKICVDVSSMNRLRIASVVWEISQVAARRKTPLDVDYVYSPAQFFKPNVHDDVYVEVSGPVIPEFAGWDVELEKPTIVILGLGYEASRAIGTIEYLEPAQAWAFVPVGIDDRFDRVVQDLNVAVGRVTAGRQVQYPVHAPVRALSQLRELATQLRPGARLVFVPMGPKVFFLLSALVAAEFWPDFALWRVTAGDALIPVNARAAGPVVGIGCKYEHGAVTSAA